MRKLEMTGKRYEHLTVIKEVEPYIKPKSKGKIIQYLCECDCGNRVVVRGEFLRNGHTTSCGCAAGKIDYTGKKFGRLTAVKHIGNKYRCVCECGNTCVILTYNLVNGNTQSCGCLQKERTSEASLINLIGIRVGKLIIEERIDNDRFNHVRYKCKCDCGGTAIVDAGRLRRNLTLSCGCVKSHGEEAINKWLTTHNVCFIPQYSHNDIFLSSGRRPFFDFAIVDSENKPVVLIEYQGLQHYETGYGWNDEENHQATVRRDEERRKECERIGIMLIEIPYFEFKNIDCILENIMIENQIKYTPDIEEAQELQETT